MRVMVLLIGLLSLVSSHAYGFDFYEWMRQWHVEVGSAVTPVSVTQPAKPITVKYCWSSYDCSIQPLHAKDINGKALPMMSITGQAPIIKIGNTSIGLQFTKEWLNADGRGDASSIGAYVLRPLVGSLAGTAWIGKTNYSLNAPGTLNWTGSAATTSMGIGIQTTMRNHMTLKVSYERTNQATITDFTYRIRNREVDIQGYQDPPFTYHPNTTLRIGIGLNTTFLPTREQLNNQQRRKDEMLLAHALHQNIPVTYYSFAASLALASTQQLGGDFAALPAGSVSWDSEPNTLVMHTATPASYLRESDFDSLINGHKMAEGVHPKFQAEYLDRTVSLVQQQVHTAKAQSNQVPSSVLMKINYNTYTRKPDGTFGADYKNHIAHISLAIDPTNENVRVVSIQTETI